MEIDSLYSFFCTHLEGCVWGGVKECRFIRRLYVSLLRYGLNIHHPISSVDAEIP